MRIAFLGPPGTFGEEAAIRCAPAAERVARASHAAVASAVDAGEADAGVVAIENSINGSVAETLDVLIHDTALQVQQEFLVPVVHHLIARPGAALQEIEVVFSHPQALGQCRKFLAARLPGAQLEAALSTAEAVRLAIERGPRAAGISTERAASLYGGAILARAIQDNDRNVTRFVLLGRDRQPITGRDRTSIAFWFADDRPGALASVLNEFAARGINCTKIESRPTRETFGEYVFLIDFDGHQDDSGGREVLAAIEPLCSSVKVFGSYPRWDA